MTRRRDFIKLGGLAGFTLASGNIFKEFPSSSTLSSNLNSGMAQTKNAGESIIGNYGQWAADLRKGLPSRSYRRGLYKDIKKWQSETRSLVTDRMGVPDIGG